MFQVLEICATGTALCDFGMAAASTVGSGKTLSTVCGSTEYMAPEVKSRVEGWLVGFFGGRGANRAHGE